MKPIFETTKNPTKYGGFYGFRVGTCEGLWRVTTDAYEILAILNHEKGNGHFSVLMEYFETSAKRDGMKLRLLECFNMRLYFNSVFRHGYKRMKGSMFNLEKTFV
jgi:hypothetical protein